MPMLHILKLFLCHFWNHVIYLLLLLQNLRRGLNYTYLCRVLNITDKHWLEQKKLGFKNKKIYIEFFLSGWLSLFFNCILNDNNTLLNII